MASPSWSMMGLACSPRRGSGGRSAPSAFATSTFFDGGMPKWKAEGRALDFGEVRRTPRHFTSRFNRGAVADVDDVKKALAHPDIQVVDARSAGRFNGTAPEFRPGLKSGHMPGALNLPYDRLLEDGRLIAPERIREKFEEAGITLDKPVGDELRLWRHGCGAVVCARRHRQRAQGAV